MCEESIRVLLQTPEPSAAGRVDTTAPEDCTYNHRNQSHINTASYLSLDIIDRMLPWRQGVFGHVSEVQQREEFLWSHNPKSFSQVGMETER